MFHRFTKNIDKIVALFSLLVILLSLYLIYTLYLSSKQKEILQSLDNALLLTKNMLDEEKSHALSLSLMLSEDELLIKYYRNKKRRKVFELINSKIKSLQQMQGYSVDVQLHDAKIYSYVRSWDYNTTGIPLATFREGIVMVKETKKPLVSIEVGKRLNIKAISPILYHGKYIGSIEVIEGFRHLREKLAQQGYAFFILLNKRYLSIATSLKKHPFVGHEYVLVNNFYDKSSFERLRQSRFENLGKYGYFGTGRYAFGYFAIYNLHNECLGYCIVALKNENAKTLCSYKENAKTEENTQSKVIIR
ncbi:cache domain-containing protein [Sulfurimonas sp.]